MGIPTRRTTSLPVILGAVSLFAAPVQLDAQCIAPSFDAGINVTAGGPGPAGEIASGDFNGDGRTDLVVPRFITNTISVIFGQATGSPTVVLVTSVIRPVAAGVGDFNNDGKPDLVVSHESNPPFFNVSIAVLLGDGAGGFGPPTGFPASLSRPLLVADFNNDNNADVFVGHSGVSQVLLGNGSGGLGAPMNVLVPFHSAAIAADLNNDGNVDLATVLDSDSGVSVALGDGTGHFTFPPTSFPGNPARSVAATDLNNDGKLDLVTAGQVDGVSVFLGNGMGGFGAATVITTGFPTVSVTVGDFNEDSKSDIATAGDNLVAILLGDGTGGPAQKANYATSRAPITVLTGDVDGDNNLDVATTNCSGCGEAASIFFGDGNGNLRLPLSLVGSSPFSIANGDLNNDGKPDLATANIGHDSVSIMLANGSGGFAPAASFSVGAQPRSVSLGDLNGDQKLDLVTANFNAGTVSVRLGDGLGGFGPSNHIPVPGFNPEYAEIADFNNDGIPDLVVAYLNADFVSILLGNGTGAFGVATSFRVPSGAQQVVVNDFNGDAKADLAVATISGVSVLLGNGAGGFGGANTLTTPTTALSVAVNDFNGDGKADIAAPIVNNNLIFVFLGDGQGNFGASTSFMTGSTSPGWIVTADYNGDANIDLATANSPGAASILLGDGAGGFSSLVTFAHGGSNTRSLTTADFNGDKKSDLAIANQAGSVSVMFNSCVATFVLPPVLSVNNTAITEGDAGIVSGSFNVTLSVASNKTVAVNLYTTALDATKDVDYQTTMGRITFPPGTISQTITVPVIGDILDEFDERFSLILAYQLNATVDQGQGQGTILDNDPPPSVSISDVSVPEGNSGIKPANFTVTLSTVSGKPITLQYDTSDGSATSGDYLSQSSSVMIPAGAISAGIAIQLNGDVILESDETFFLNLSNPVNVTIAKAQGVGTILNDDSLVQFGASSFIVSETGPRVDISVTRSGDTSGIASVGFTSNDGAGLTNCNVFDGIASPRCDYINTLGTMSFAVGETSKTFSVAIIDDSFAEGSETFTIGLNSPSGTTLDGQSTAIVTITDNEVTNGTNPIDNTNFFVRQQYLDFLGREPDPPGFASWVNIINNCTGDTTQCDRIHVSQLFFQSAEFQERGYFVYRFYPVAFGRKPDYNEFVPALASVSGFLNDNQLETAKVAFIADFMAQPGFANTYNPLNNTQYVDMLLNTGGVVLSSRQSMIDGLNNSSLSRAQVLRQIVESSEVSTKYNHQAYAVMEYFGYLRREPDALYLDWIALLDQTNNPRLMVTGFVNSPEYRQRFGP